MSDISKATRSLFEQVGGVYDTALRSTASALAPADAADADPEFARAFATLREQLDADGRAALEAAVVHALQLFAHGFFAVLDGASAGEHVRLIDDRGADLDAGLHEYWVEFLLETGRMDDEEELA